MKKGLLLASGGYFHFDDMENSPIRIEDIAHALSNACRYAGHCPQFYSVAQHSVHVSEILPPELQLYGLLHDASEAYLGDVVKPLKILLPDFCEVERKLEGIICRTFGLPEQMPGEVKHADAALLGTEQRDIMKNYDNWPFAAEPCRHLKIEPWSPAYARREFMHRFTYLTK